jgi:hypothetical protein
MFASERASVGVVFKNVILIPGTKVYFIASDNELSYDYDALILEKNLTAQFINIDYLQGILTDDRIDAVDIPAGKQNLDYNPISYRFQLTYWMQQFNSGYIGLVILAILALVLILTRIKPIPFAVFTTGFAGSSIMVLLLISFQIQFGFVYHRVGLLITTFMIGLALGSIYMNKKSGNYKTLITFQF